MPRTARATPGGYVYHVLNRAVARLPLLQKDGDFEAFVRVMIETKDKHAIRLLGFCLMPNHWHLLLWPRRDGELSAFIRWLTHTHTMRWHAHYHSSGSGHVYQGRFKAFPIQEDEHFYSVARYVERNPLRANLVRKAQAWRWSSLGQEHASDAKARVELDGWPVPRPEDWIALVNEAQTEKELEALRRAAQRGSPYGDDGWQKRLANKLGLEHMLRSPGRPRKT
jgi:putative transposase